MLLFDPSLRVQGNTGRQDKIDFTMDAGILSDPSVSSSSFPQERRRDSAAFVDHVMGFLAGPQQGEQNPVDGLDSPRSRIFGRPHGRKGTILKVFQRHLGGRSHPPLFSGQLACSNSGSWLGFTFTAYANLTRYVRHQTSPIQGTRGSSAEDNVQLLETLFSRSTLYSPDEFSLDGKDNWLFRGSRVQSIYANWQQRQLDYFRAIQFAIFNDLDRVARNSHALGHPLDITRWGGERLSLQNVETYWEFLSPDPLLLVEHLHDDLESYCEGGFERREFESQAPSQGRVCEETEKNCPVLYANVAPGITLVIYAKTNKRVRFEVRHDLSEVSNRRRLSQTCQNPVEAVARLADIANDASQVLNRFLTFLHSRGAPVPVSYSPVELVFRCNRCCESAGYAESILSMLIVNNRVVALEPLRKSLAKMERDGLIQKPSNEQGQQTQVFNIAPPFADALETLRTVNGTRRLAVRMRRRNP